MPSQSHGGLSQSYKQTGSGFVNRSGAWGLVAVLQANRVRVCQAGMGQGDMPGSVQLWQLGGHQGTYVTTCVCEIIKCAGIRRSELPAPTLHFNLCVLCTSSCHCFHLDSGVPGSPLVSCVASVSSHIAPCCYMSRMRVETLLHCHLLSICCPQLRAPVRCVLRAVIASMLIQACLACLLSPACLRQFSYGPMQLHEQDVVAAPLPCAVQVPFTIESPYVLPLFASPCE